MNNFGRNQVMNSGKYFFAQVLSLVNRYEFQKCVDRYKGDYRSRELNCWNQFAQLFFELVAARCGTGQEEPKVQGHPIKESGHD